LVIAHSVDRKRVASCRIALESCEWMFPFEEPTPDPESLVLKRMIAPAREAAKTLGKNISKATEEFGGKWPGRVELDVDARCGIAVLEILAQHFDVNCGMEPPREMTDFDHAAIPFFAGLYDELIEQGYLGPEMCSPRLAEWIRLWGH
jgi:hypothetical protein